MKKTLLAAVLGLATATSAFAADTYAVDTGHAQVVFSYDHLGFSTTYGMFGDITGAIEFDSDNPAASSVSVSFPVTTLMTGLAKRDEHFLSGDFFGADENETVTFVSTGIEITGDTTALITGDLTVNGITKSVVLDTTMTKSGEHPMAKKPWMGFVATTSVMRSEFDMGTAVPFVGDEVTIDISIEAMAEG